MQTPTNFPSKRRPTRVAHTLKGGDIVILKLAGERRPSAKIVFDTVAINGLTTGVRVVGPTGVVTARFPNNAEVPTA